MYRAARDVSGIPNEERVIPRATTRRISVWKRDTPCSKSRTTRRLTGICRKKLLPTDQTRSPILDLPDINPDPIRPFQDLPGNSPTKEIHGRRILPHLINRQHTVHDHVGLSVRELGEDETWAVAQRNLVGEHQCLEMLGLSGSARDRDLFGSEEGVDGGGLADVGVADKTDHELGRAGLTGGGEFCVKATRQ
jgi:hypothetical protein